MNKSSPLPRSSSPPSASTGRLTAELQPVINELNGICNQYPTILHHALTATESLLRLRHTFIDNDHPREAKDAFRLLHGFQTLLELARKLAELYDAITLSRQERKDLLTLFKDVLGVLAESLKEHSGNKRYFAKIVGGGSTSLEQTLVILAGKLDEDEGSPSDTELLYGGILAAALCQETIAGVFTALSLKFQPETVSPSEIRTAVDQSLGTAETVEVPEFLGPFLRVWLAQSSAAAGYAIQRLAVPACLCQLALQSRRNILALHATGMLTSILPILVSADRPQNEKALYQELAELLCVQGINKLDDAVDLYRRAHDCPEVSRFLLEAIKSSKDPPCIHFDMLSHGYASVEFSTLGRPFPPATSAGYTLAVWARFDKFDPNAHTTIFGAFDATQTCFVLAYLEKDTRNFILQTSIRGPRPSVRFKSFVFQPDQWYHICVIHKKSRVGSSSRASLFVNGEFVEQLKIEYPSTPVGRHPNKSPRVQAFLGTPQDLAVRLGKGVSTSRWSLASAILFEEAFSDDVVAVFYNLGPRYHGNFQDCLGSFQTYKASAALNLRNESLHPGKEEYSEIVTAIRQKASTLIPEQSVLINISPTTVLDDDDTNNVDESQLVKSLSKQAAKNLHKLTKTGGNAVAINGAIPAINDALTHSHGIGILTGDPVVTVPQSLDDASWRIGGCAAVHLSMVHAASTAENTLLAVEILFEAVQDNWRNSEAMERENGYGILASLLREKIGFPLGSFAGSSRTSTVCSNNQDRSALAIKLLRLTLEFVGYDFENPNRSIIINPLAYRVLLVDLDIWRFGELPLLQLYYSQFRTFAAESQYRRFNAKRLARMRVNKKLLDALKGEQFTEESLGLFISAFRPLLNSCLSAELLRSLALFITYAIHKTKSPAMLQKKKSLRFDARTRRLPPAEPTEKYLPSPKIGVEMLRMYCSVLCAPEDFATIKKFARTVTNKWLLYLMSEDDPEVVVLAAKILARLIIVHGSNYNKKFSDKTGGYVILRHRLKRWWNVPALWPICFAVLFGFDAGRMDLDRPFDHLGFLDLFMSGGEAKVVFPEILPVITEMLQSGLKKVTLAKEQPAADRQDGSSVQAPQNQQQGYSMSSSIPLEPLSTQTTIKEDSIFSTVVGFLADVHARSQNFRDFAATSDYVQKLLFVLFPIVVGSDIVSAEVELNSRDGRLSFSDNNVITRPRTSVPPVLRTTTVEPSAAQDEGGRPLRRASSFILVSSDKAKYSPSTARLRHISMPKIEGTGTLAGHSIVQSVLELVVAVFSDQLLVRKDFPGLNLYLKIPPGFLEHQAFFESWLLRNFLSELGNAILLDQKVLLEPRVLSNLARFLTHIGEALYEGWFIDGANATLDFIGSILEYLQRPDVSSLKSVRLCSQAITTIRSIVFRTVLLKLSEAGDDESLSFLNRLAYWQAVLLSAGETQVEYLKLLCYLLYAKLISYKEEVRLTAASLWRIILVQKPSETSAILSHATPSLQRRLSGGFEKLVGMDDTAFLLWVDDQRDDLDAFFFGTLSRFWEAFVHEENTKTEESARNRISKRKDKLKQWNQDEKTSEEVIRKHDVTFDHWVSNITMSESLKYQRVIQDQHDNSAFMWSAFSRLSQDLRRFGGVLAEEKEKKWRLDQTEGRSRMRLRIIPDESGERQDYQPKRKASEPPAIKVDPQVKRASSSETLGITPAPTVGESMDNGAHGADSDDKSVLEESFEMIEDPKADLDDYEDKNRKVMRSLHRGDQVQSVCNMSRIIGLEACEGLLIIGKDSIYILDNFFQRADGEIVNVWQAPPEERDPYVRMIAGRESSERKSLEHETRSWKWADLISVSKRRFLFRDVALEVFFTDGRSYLLTLISSRARDDLYNQLSTRAPQINGSINLTRPEDVWRFETLRIQDNAPQSLGSKFASVFGHSASNPATRRWLKGEISNFHYLMLINTLAGRTFNDLTQYPVFPWVLADYTSEELDLSNPKSFRDLSKPMGCQTPEREAEFRERYKSFAEMGDDNAPPFHYGTHYSSAMIVSSYLIRLQPFVKSYLLLQGGTFDHADRLFYSVRKAWESASGGNMSDVRELIPEFFYLPEFLVNTNKYDFGLRQNMTESIDSVELPPWAKGDPKIFIAKHREALESPYVTQNLHHWIDLVFGFKQKGEAALDAVNVFHHLSYQGAKDIDSIEDPVERLATIGIIHNFGQTPHQVFQRPHPRREELQHKDSRLDVLAESLTCQPISLLDSQERVASLSMKQDRLLCAAAFRLNIPPSYDKYMEWGFFDGSVRFYAAESRKLLGHFEHLHIGQLSSAIFADSQTLITSGTDCTISIWTFTSTAKSVDLQPKACLFGHRSPVTVLAVSRSFSAVLSASTDGQIMLWDLNRQCFVRELPANGPVECARINDVTGNIAICRGNRVSLYTLNGALMLDQPASETTDDYIVSCAFYEGANNEWLERELLFTGHKRGLVNIWSKTIRHGRFELDLIRQLHHVNTGHENGGNVSAGISCILPLPQVVYTGDEAGRVYEWDCIQRR
ncbi:hypothetical protein VTN00DRAFT_1158 [Thermoascus crustaceus]|uniref:uncharacterized protein n=1 Tax=Thermoascus crustaceus TaxID=5088 RepID=UPI0037437796